jgi:hypothetical protein
MSLQTDILWIQNEITKVKDPDLLEVFKRLLLMRKKHSVQTIEEYNHDIELSERDIADGRVHTQSQIENLRGEWKKSL